VFCFIHSRTECVDKDDDADCDVHSGEPNMLVGVDAIRALLLALASDPAMYRLLAAVPICDKYDVDGISGTDTSERASPVTKALRRLIL